MSDFQWVCDAGGPVVTWVDCHHLGERQLEADRLRSLEGSDDAGCGIDECWVFRASGVAKTLEGAALLAAMTA